MFDQVFLQLVKMSITACYVIVTVLVIRVFLKKLPKAFSYCLWSVVGFRLLCPFSISSVISIFNLRFFNSVDKLSSGIMQYDSSTIKNIAEPTITMDVMENAQTINAPLSVSEVGAGANPIQIIISIATWVWIVGIVVILLYSFLSFIKTKKHIKKAVHMQENIYECDGIGSPFVIGVWKPRIYIPFRLRAEEQEYILKHEQYHIKRKDYLVKIFAFLLTVIYWFQPMIWVAYFFLCRDMEMSCDEKIVQEMGTDIKRNYSRSLISFATNRRQSLVGPLAFGETDTRKRIKNILGFKQPKIYMLVVGMVLVIVICLVCVTNGRHENSVKVKSITDDIFEKSDINYNYSLQDEVKSYVVYVDLYENGIVQDRTILACENIDSNNLNCQSNISMQFTKSGDETNNTVSIVYGFGAIRQFKAFFLPNKWSIWTQDILWDDGKMHDIKLNEEYILTAQYFGKENTTNLNAYKCEDLMEADREEWNEYISQDAVTIVVYFALSDMDKENLQNRYIVTDLAKELYENKNTYIGDFQANGRLIKCLGINEELDNFTTELFTKEEPYILRLNFEKTPDNVNLFNQKMQQNAAILLALIDNASEIQWTYETEEEESLVTVTYNLEQANQEFGNIKEYGRSVEKVQELLDKLLEKKKIEDTNSDPERIASEK